MSGRTRRLLPWAAALFAAVAAAWLAWANLQGEDPLSDATPEATPQAIERGAYLVRAGNCAGCHTARGGPAFAGGRPIETPFGAVYASNLTPDRATGLGDWTAAQFWRALHNGRGRDGRLLVPAFPYTSFTQVTREDADAMFLYLRTLPPVQRAPTPHALRFPYNTQAALAVWRALYFSPGTYTPDTAQSASWNRGAYLVRGLGHCAACHGPRTFLGGSTDEAAQLGGGRVAALDWEAPPLSQASIGTTWRASEVVQLLKTGVSPRGVALGPMAEVVARSTQHLADEDLRAIAVYLERLPHPEPVRREKPARDPTQLALGGRLYKQHCADCHGKQGEGAGDGIYPPLAGNRTVLLDNPANLLHVIANGGFPPSTAANPRPYGMPPFGQALNDRELAALASFVRQSWGNDVEAVQALSALRVR